MYRALALITSHTGSIFTCHFGHSLLCTCPISSFSRLRVTISCLWTDYLRQGGSRVALCGIHFQPLLLHCRSLCTQGLHGLGVMQRARRSIHHCGLLGGHLQVHLGLLLWCWSLARDRSRLLRCLWGAGLGRPLLWPDAGCVHQQQSLAQSGHLMLQLLDGLGAVVNILPGDAQQRCSQPPFGHCNFLLLPTSARLSVMKHRLNCIFL